MQETPVNHLVPTLVEQLHAGRDLRQLSAAAALANARTFDGESHVGFHTMMAFAPAWHMAQERYEGTLVFISHDVHFIRKLATNVLHVNAGQITAYEGGYD